MNKDDFKKALETLKKNSQKRKFTQTYDFIINLKDLDLKVPEQQVELWIPVPHALGKPVKVGAFVGAELIEQAKKVCDRVVLNDEFKLYANDKKKIRALAQECNYFIAQVTTMQELAKIFGRVFGPRGKMPNPKAGCVVPPNANLTQLVERLKKTVHVAAKTQTSIKCSVGTEQLSDDQIVDNILAIYTAVVHALPTEDKNIKSVLLKFTMSAPVHVGVQEKTQEK